MRISSASVTVARQAARLCASFKVKMLTDNGDLGMMQRLAFQLVNRASGANARKLVAFTS
jgi:hypothetical protein